MSKRTGMGVLALGVVVGIVGVLAFDWTMHATNTDEFCTSCHGLSIAQEQLMKTSHYINRSGMVASCSDCHVPKEFVPKMVRKVEAVREVWGSIQGVIDTPEKYAAHAPAMKEREIARLKANDSQECRNCHQTEHMLSVIQSSKAQRFHRALKNNRRTCIDCHAGIAHPDNSG